MVKRQFSGKAANGLSEVAAKIELHKRVKNGWQNAQIEPFVEYYGQISKDKFVITGYVNE